LEPIFITGCRKKHLHQEDLCDVPNHARSEKILSTFHKYWLQELEGNRNPRLWIAVVKLLWLKVFFYGILSCVEVFLVSGQAIMVGLLADYFAGEITDESTRNAILYALGIATLALSVAFVHSHGYLQGQDAGMMARIALTGIVYKKIFSLSLGTISEATIGKIITLASYDVQRVEKVFYFAPFVVTGPLNIIVVLVLLWVYLGLGPSSLAGVGVIVLFIPLSFGLGLLFAKLR
jgi:ATP-binding cassette subfamily C (CFTR/MRP) protein 4